MDFTHKLTLDGNDFSQTMNQAGKQVQDFERHTDEASRALDGMSKESSKSTRQLLQEISAMEHAGRSTTNYKKQLSQMQRQLVDLQVAYQNMTREERTSPIGRETAKRIEELKQRAAQIRDIVADTQAEINNLASDTSGWDSLQEAIQLTSSVLQTFTGIAGLSEDSQKALVRAITMMQTAQAAANTVIQVGNALQKQSALMLGITKVQSLALAAAESLRATATSGATIATKAATVAQAAFNLVAKANPYVLLATAVIGATAAVVAFTKKTLSATEAEKKQRAQTEKLKREQEEYARDFSQSASKMLASYTKLQLQWKSLRTEQEKNAFISDNAQEFENLGLKITDVTSAESQLVGDTQTVVDAMMKRARAAAAYSRVETAYADLLEAQEKVEQKQAEIREKGYDQPRRELPKPVGASFPQNLVNKATESIINRDQDRANAEEQAMQDELEAAKKHLEQVKKQYADAYSEISDTITNTTKKAEKPVKQKTTTAKEARETGKTTHEAVIEVDRHLQEQRLELLKDEHERQLAEINLEYERELDSARKYERELLATMDTSKIGDQMKQMFQGNVDLLARPLVNAAELVKKGWQEAGDGIATVYSSQYGIEDANGREVEILVTPILPDGTVLTEKELEDYVFDVLSGAQSILDADSKGIVIATNVSVDGQAGEKLHRMQAEYYDITDEMQARITQLYETAAEIRNQKVRDAEANRLKIEQDMQAESMQRWRDYYKQYGTLAEQRLALEQEYAEKIASAQDEAERLLLGAELGKKLSEVDALDIKVPKDSIRAIEDEISNIHGRIELSTNIDEIRAYQQQVDILQARIDQMQGIKVGMSFSDYIEGAHDMVSAIDSVKSSWEDFSEAVEDGDAWDVFSSLADSVFTTIEAITRIIETIEQFTKVTEMMRAVNKAASADAVSNAAAETAAATATTTAKASEAVASATASGAKMPFPFNVVAIGTAIAAVLAALANIGKFAGGGIVGGNSRLGDMNLARVNAGEMILNGKQQANLFKIIDEGRAQQANGGLFVQDVRVRGADLYLTLSNYSKTIALSGRKTKL